MKRPLALILVAGLTAYWLAGEPERPRSIEPRHSRPGARAGTSDGRTGRSDRIVHTRAHARSSDEVGDSSDGPRDAPAQGPRAAPAKAKPVDPAAPRLSAQVTASPAPATSPKHYSQDGSPSIGAIKVLGHRGCDANTQGWFLSVGNPEQYDFTVSDDGETVVVEPNTRDLTGNFEFVHCADPGELVGRRVRFTARIQAEGVTGLAQLRFRGEDLNRNKNLYDDVKVGGTHGFKDYALEIDVGPEVALFSYGLSFRAQGKLWLSSPAFGIVR